VISGQDHRWQDICLEAQAAGLFPYCWGHFWGGGSHGGFHEGYKNLRRDDCGGPLWGVGLAGNSKVVRYPSTTCFSSATFTHVLSAVTRPVLISSINSYFKVCPVAQDPLRLRHVSSRCVANAKRASAVANMPCHA